MTKIIKKNKIILMLKKGDRAIFGIYNDFYKSLLTKQQEEIINMYYNEDLSITEISQNLNISRQAVLDSIQKTEKKLNLFETNLKIFKKTTQIRDLVENIKETKDITMLDDIIKILEE